MREVLAVLKFVRKSPELDATFFAFSEDVSYDWVYQGVRIAVMGPGNMPITELLAATGRGEAGARHQLMLAVYEELRSIARSQMAREAAGRTLQPTALVNEAYMKLFPTEHVAFSNRGHFFASAAIAMRRIRVDDARARTSQKRGGDQSPESLDSPPAWFDQDPTEVLTVDDALKELESIAPRAAQVVVLRYFSGMSIDETAAALGISPRTVDNEWHSARAWLHRTLSADHQ